MIQKFRAWHKKDKYMFIPTKLELYRDGLMSMVTGKDPSGKLILHDIAEVELMQSTGRKDKNGKEIFQKDALKTATGIYIVNDLLDFGYRIGECTIIPEQDEVIGNVFENHELTKEKGI